MKLYKWFSNTVFRLGKCLLCYWLYFNRLVHILVVFGIWHSRVASKNRSFWTDLYQKWVGCNYWCQAKSSSLEIHLDQCTCLGIDHHGLRKLLGFGHFRIQWSSIHEIHVGSGHQTEWYSLRTPNAVKVLGRIYLGLVSWLADRSRTPKHCLGTKNFQ